MEIYNDSIITGTPRAVLPRLRAGILRQSKNCAGFYIGITSDYWRRSSSYASNYDDMVVLYRTTSEKYVRQVEHELVDYFWNTCDNLTGGGGGGLGRQPFFLYIVCVRRSTTAIRAAQRREFEAARELVTRAASLASGLTPLRQSHASIYGDYVGDALHKSVLALVDIVDELRRMILDSLERADFSRCEEFLGILDYICRVIDEVHENYAVPLGLGHVTGPSHRAVKHIKDDLVLYLRHHKLETALEEFRRRVGLGASPRWM